MSKVHIKKGDTVKVIAGNEKGKTGVVQKIIAEKDRAIVEGLKCKFSDQSMYSSTANDLLRYF